MLGEELIEEIKLVREERKQLEWTRQELLRKGKDLLAQNRHRRNQGEEKIPQKNFRRNNPSPYFALTIVPYVLPKTCNITVLQCEN